MYIFAAFLIVSLFEPLYCLDLFFLSFHPNALDHFFCLEVFFIYASKIKTSLTV